MLLTYLECHNILFLLPFLREDYNVKLQIKNTLLRIVRMLEGQLIERFSKWIMRTRVFRLLLNSQTSLTVFSNTETIPHLL